MANLTLPFNLKSTGNIATDMQNVSNAARSEGPTAHGDKTRNVSDTEVNQIFDVLKQNGALNLGKAIGEMKGVDPELWTQLRAKVQGY